MIIIIIGRQSLERHSLCALVNLWWCCNVWCGSLYHSASRGLGEKRGGAVFAAIALLSLLVTFHVGSFDYFFHFPSPAGTITRNICPIVWINFSCFEVMFACFLEPQSGAPRRSWPLSSIDRIERHQWKCVHHPCNELTYPIHLRRCWLTREYMLGTPACVSISLSVMRWHLTPRMHLRHRRWREFKRCTW